MADDKKKVKGKVDVNNDGEVDKLDDLNNDGRADKQDVRLEQDRLSMEYLGQDYETAARIVGADASLQQLFRDAIKNGYTEQQFDVALAQTDWAKNQGTEFAQKAWLAEKAGGPSWDEQFNLAREQVQRAATQAGASLSPTDLDTFARRYLYEGWYEGSRAVMMQDALASFVTKAAGMGVKVDADLRKLAANNGVTLDEGFYTSSLQAILRGEQTQADAEKFIREQAAAKFPLYKDKILAGFSVRDLASPYISRINEILEIPMDSISLDDMYVRSALGKFDDKGNPTYMNLDEFETMLRNDPRWENTKNGKNTLLKGVETMMRDWGFVY